MVESVKVVTRDKNCFARESRSWRNSFVSNVSPFRTIAIMGARVLVVVAILCILMDFVIGLPYQCDATGRDESIALPLVCLILNLFLLVLRHSCPIASEIRQVGPVEVCGLDLPFSRNQRLITIVSICSMFVTCFLIAFRVAALFFMSRGCEWTALLQLVFSIMTLLILWALLCCQFRRIPSSWDGPFQCADEMSVIVPIPPIIVSQSTTSQ